MPTPRRLGHLALLAALTSVFGLLLAAPATATYPGPNGRIAFAHLGTGQIYSINPDGTGLRQLTRVAEPAVAGQPDWSPDGRQIAFFSDLSGDARLYVMDRDGANRRLVFAEQPGYQDVFPRYTPDGNRFVFQRCRPPDNVCAIYSVRVDGTQLRALTQFQGGMQETVDSDPSVSLDGHRIAFVRFFAGGIWAQVHVMWADGSGAHPVTPPALEAFGPDWTPDGRQILVSSKCCRPNSAIYQVRPDGTGLQRLTSPRYPNNDVDPSASPQGNQIVFASDRPYPDLCCKDLFIMRADGSALHQVPTGLDGVVDPDWGPAPHDDGTGTATMTTGSRDRGRAGSEASSARLCASGPTPRPLGRCGTRAAFEKFGDP